jgi:hypothetical protein
MKVGDKVKFKEWEGGNDMLTFSSTWGGYVGKECVVIEIDDSTSTRLRVPGGSELWIPNSAISPYEESLIDQVKDRYLNQYVFQGYSYGNIAEDQFIYIDKIEDGKTSDGFVAYYPNTKYIGSLYMKGKFTGRTVEEEIKSRYKVGDRIKDLATGNYVDLDRDEFLITIVPDDQTIWISYSHRPFLGKIMVYDKGTFTEVVAKPIDTVAPKLNDTFMDRLADEMINPEDVQFTWYRPNGFQQTTEQVYALAVPNDCDAIKTKRSKGLDVNIKSSKFVIPKIK